MSKFGTKNAWFTYFWAGNWNVIFEISSFEVVKLQNFAKKQKCLNLGPKNAFIWVFLGWNFKKTIVIFETGTFELVYLKNFVKKQKCLILGPKMPYLGIFDQECLIWVFLGKNFENTIVRFEIGTLEFV